MDRFTKAMLLSVLVFPGAGQLYLRRYVRACLFLVPTIMAIYYFSSVVLKPVMAIALQIQNGAIPLDILAIEARLHQDGQVGSPLVNLAALTMVVCWIGSAADAWFVGRTPPAQP